MTRIEKVRSEIIFEKTIEKLEIIAIAIHETAVAGY